MTSIIARKDLGKGLELRVEPSFRFTHTDKELTPEGFCKIVKEREPQGLDLSLYKDGRLCSPKFTYEGDLQKFEADINRELPEQKASSILVPLVKKLTRRMPNELRRVYEILDVDATSFDFDLNNHEYLRMDSRMTCEDILYLISRRLKEPKIIEEFWVREYPIIKTTFDGLGNQMMPDRYLGNSFSIYFWDSRRYEEMDLKKAAFLSNLHRWHDNSELVELSEATIMSLAYGYRMRVIGFDERLIKDTIIS